jgi:hypothetical protein
MKGKSHKLINELLWAAALALSLSAPAPLAISQATNHSAAQPSSSKRTIVKKVTGTITEIDHPRAGTSLTIMGTDGITYQYGVEEGRIVGATAGTLKVGDRVSVEFYNLITNSPPIIYGNPIRTVLLPPSNQQQVNNAAPTAASAGSNRQSAPSPSGDKVAVAGGTVAARYIEALQKGDFRTVIDLSYGYQAEVAQIKAQNPQVLWPKLTNQYYDAKIAALSRKPGSGTYLATFLQGMTGDPAQQIQFMQNMVLPNAKWKVTETRTEHVRDQFDGHEYDRTVVYITVAFPTLNDSPFVDGEFLKETILEVDLNAKLEQVMTVGRVAQGDTPWDAPVTIMNAKWQREGLAGMGGLSAEAFGGKAPYIWKPVCGPYDLSNSIINQPTNQQVPASLVVNLQRFPTNVAFPLHCSLTVTDGKGQSDAVGITVPQMLTGVSELCYVREPWFSRGQGRPAQSNMCLNPLRATDTASASNSSTALVPPSTEAPPSTPGADQGNSYGGRTASAGCNGYADCFKAGIKSYEAANQAEAMADFQAASDADPKQGQAWYWQGIVMLKGHQINQVGQLARVWDKALSLGSLVAISACHERGIQPCERGDLMLSSKSVAFSRGSTQFFNVPPQQTEPGRILNNAAFAHVTYGFKTGGKNYTFDFVPSTWQTCKFDLMVQCPQSGFAEQLILAQYVAQTLPKLASGGFGPGAGAAPAGSKPDATQQLAAGDSNSHGANAGEADTILIDTDTGPVRVKNFHKRSLGQDEFGDEILEKTPAHVTTYGAEMSCFYDSKRKGCFSIELLEKSDHSDELRSQHSLMDMLGVSLQDFCKLPVAVVSVESSVEGTKVSTPPAICPNGQFHNQ